MDISTKKQLDAYIADVVKGAIGEQFAEIRKENEDRAKALENSFTRTAVTAPVQKTAGIVRIVQALAFARGDVSKAAAFAKEKAFDENVIKALSTQPNSGGGYLVPPDYSTEIIDLLYNTVAVRKLGAVSIPMPNGSITIPKVATGVTAAYVGENQGQNAQQGTFGVVQMSWKKLRATVPISNDLIRFSNPRVDSLVQSDLVNAFRVAEDAYFLRGTGSGMSPKGLENWIPTSSPDHSVGAASATGADLTLVIDDLYKLVRLLEESNIPFIKPGFIIAPRTKQFLMTVRDSVGGFYFAEEMRRGTLLGFPFVSTNQVPVTIGGTGSVIYFGDFNDALIGEASELMLDVSTEAAYLDDTGALVSAFALDQTVIRAIARHDFSVRRVESFAMLTGVQWGA